MDALRCVVCEDPGSNVVDGFRLCERHRRQMVGRIFGIPILWDPDVPREEIRIHDWDGGMIARIQIEEA